MPPIFSVPSPNKDKIGFWQQISGFDIALLVSPDCFNGLWLKKNMAVAETKIQSIFLVSGENKFHQEPVCLPVKFGFRYRIACKRSQEDPLNVAIFCRELCFVLVSI